MIINEMPGLALDSTTGQASELQYNKTLYNSDGDLITGTLRPNESDILSGVTIAGVTGTFLNQVTTAVASDGLSGKTWYNNSGNLVSGSITNYNGSIS